MKRCLTKLVVFLLLGAIVNVAVAWGCAKWSNWLETIIWLETPVTMSSPAAWQLDNVPKSWPDKPAYAATGGNGWKLLTDQVWTLDDKVFMLSEMRFGVPAKSFAYYRLLAQSSSTYWSEYRYANQRFGGNYPLPLHPIWPGFAIDTIFYAALTWILWSSPFAARRMIRRRRGHCIKCGYDLRGDFSAGCPECGWRRERSS